MKRTQRGFTIVELLIVIVIIAVLASISIVLFNGVQARARNSARRAEMAQVFKLITLYKTDTGTDLDAVNGTYYCIGTGFPNGKCRDSYQSNPTLGVEESDKTITNMLAKYGSLPTSHFPATSVGKTVGPFIWTWADGWGYSIVAAMEGESLADCPAEMTYLWWNDDESSTLLCAKDAAYPVQNAT